MRAEERFIPRVLRPEERALLASAIASTGEDAAKWRDQVSQVIVVGGCQCGCGTIDFGSPGRERETGEYKPRILADGVYEEDGVPFGIILFANEGCLWTLEIYSLTGKDGTRYPSPDQVNWLPGPHG